MSEMKRPEEVEMYMVGGLRKSVYPKADADAYIAALERRARIAERLANKLKKHVSLEICCAAHENAVREIDAELAKEQAK